MAFDVDTYLPGDILAKVDTATMVNSIEGRSPYLDSTVVDLACSLPLSEKIGGSRGDKHLLRKAFSDRLPDGVLNRPKQGFGIPRSRWLRGRWRKAASKLLRSERSDGFHDLFDPEEVDRLLSEHQRKAVNHGGRLWALMVLRTWLRVGDVRL